MTYSRCITGERYKAITTYSGRAVIYDYQEQRVVAELPLALAHDWARQLENKGHIDARVGLRRAPSVPGVIRK